MNLTSSLIICILIALGGAMAISQSIYSGSEIIDITVIEKTMVTNGLSASDLYITDNNDNAYGVDTSSIFAELQENKTYKVRLFKFPTGYRIIEVMK